MARTGGSHPPNRSPILLGGTDLLAEKYKGHLRREKMPFVFFYLARRPCPHFDFFMGLALQSG
jgi:hypothetical protein